MLEKAFELAVVFSAVDHMTGPISSMARELGVLDERTKETQKRMSEFKNMAWVGGAITGIGIAGAVGMEKLAEKAADVQQQLIQLGSVYGLNIDSSQLKAIEEQAQAISQKTLFSKQDLLGIDVELAHAGISKDNLSKVMPEATYLAEIEKGIGKSSSPQNTAYNFAKMSEDAGITSNAEKMQKFADDINRVINTTHASTESLSESFKYGMPVAKNLGWTENDMLMANGMAARNGMEGSMAGTHIKDFIERINPYKYLGTTGGQKQLGAMQDMGLIGDVQTVTKKGGKTEITGFGTAALLKDKDHLKSYADMIDVLTKKHDEFLAKGGNKDALKGVDPKDIEKIQEQAKLTTGKELSGGNLEWAAMANKVWGEQGQDFAILSSNKEMFDKLKKNMEIQKSLHEQIDVIRNSYNGQMHIMESNLTTVGLQIGKPLMEMLLPVINKVGNALDRLIQFLNNHPTVAKFAAGIMALATAAALVIGPLMIFVGLMGYLKTSGTVAASVELLGKAFTGLFSPTTLVIGLIVGLGAGLVHLYNTNETFRKTVTEAWGNIQELGSVAFGDIKKFMGEVKDKITELADKFSKFKDKELKDLKKDMDNFKKTMDDNKAAIQNTATILGIFFAPALIRTGAQAVITGAQITVSFIASIVRSGAEAVITGGKIAISFIGNLIKAGIQAGITAATITTQLIVATISYGVEGWKAAEAIAAQTIAWIANKAQLIATTIALTAQRSATVLATAATWLFNAALDANPIGVVIIALAALGIAIYEVVKHWQDICTWIEKAWNWLTKWNDTKMDSKTAQITTIGMKKPGENANGTDYWRGGLTWVGERGAELVNLPRGSQVIPNHKTGSYLDNLRSSSQQENMASTSNSSNKSDSQGANGDVHFHGDIIINAQPGQSPKELAQQVYSELGRLMKNKSYSRATAATSMW